MKIIENDRGINSTAVKSLSLFMERSLKEFIESTSTRLSLMRSTRKNRKKQKNKLGMRLSLIQR